jgi:hypothetical protein
MPFFCESLLSNEPAFNDIGVKGRRKAREDTRETIVNTDFTL